MYGIRAISADQHPDGSHLRPLSDLVRDRVSGFAGRLPAGVAPVAVSCPTVQYAKDAQISGGEMSAN